LNVLVFLFLAAGWAQAAPRLHKARQVQAQLALERLRVDGRQLSIHWPSHRASPRMIRNLSFRVEGRDNAARARRFLELIPELVGSTSQLEPLSVRGTRDVAVHRFRQVFQGVAVEGGGVSVVFDRAGLIRALHVDAEPVRLETVTPKITPAQAAAVAEQVFLKKRGVGAPAVETPRLLILSGATPRLAFKLQLRGDPTFRFHYVDARDGRYLGSRRGMIVDAHAKRKEVRR
jgi:hypothetical protein